MGGDVIEYIKSTPLDFFKREKKRRDLRKSFYEFFKYFWDSIISENLNDNWHIKYLCDELQTIGERVAKRLPKEYDYYIINVPPGSSKSTIISEMYPLWCWTIDPSQRFICASSSSTIAEDLAGRCYNIYQSDKFKEMYPELVEKSGGGKTNFKNGLKGERFTTSASSVITGVHAHQKILDDILGSQQAASKTERDSVNKWLKETISSRNVDAEITTTIIVMQRLHEDDPTGHLLYNPNLRIKHICIPAELSEDVKPVELKKFYKDGLFDPVRKPKHVLEVAKADLGSYGYAGQMQQRPAPEGGGIIKKEWLKILTNPIPPNTTIKFQIDPAYTEKTTNDPTAIVGYYTLNNNVFVTSAISVYKEFPDLILWLPEYLKDSGYTKRSMIYTEPKACFVAGTLVRTSKGLKPIDKVKKGDFVLSFNVSKKTPEFKPVLHTFCYNNTLINRELITFHFNNGYTIKCTSNHEFYVKGDWVRASELARRIMELRSQFGQQVFSVNRGEADKSLLENAKHIQPEVFVASKRCGRVLSNSIKNRREKEDTQSSPDNTRNFCSKYSEPPRGEPYKLHKERQPFDKFGMGGQGSEYAAHDEVWQPRWIFQRNETEEPYKRIENVECNFNGEGCFRDKGATQKQRIYAELETPGEVGDRIRGKTMYYSKRFTQGMEASELCLDDIAYINITNENIPIYDLCVEDNHNYCLGNENIIVHNSGKSIVQQIQKTTNLNITESDPPKDDKLTRVHIVSPKIESERIGLHFGAWNDSFISQLISFPKALHDDEVDCLVAIIIRELMQEKPQSLSWLSGGL